MKLKNIFLTGGTGSFGQKFVQMTLKKYKNCCITIYSRDELKQWEMSGKFNDKRLKFIIGDIRDKARLNESISDIDLIVHAAATKIVPTSETNPTECIKTNIDGAINVIYAAKKNQVKKIIALSTDKACNPVNLYGATKLASDKLFMAANSSNKLDKIKFSVVRYGNVIGSRGSIVPFFLNQEKKNILTITDKNMTRFMITRREAVDMVWDVAELMQGGEIFIKKIPSMNIMDIAKAIAPKAQYKIIGMRPGEKIHEQMIGLEDAPHTYEYDDHYKILPAIYNWSSDPKRNKGGAKVDENFTYSSDQNKEWMSVKDLQDWIEVNKSKIGKI